MGNTFGTIVSTGSSASSVTITNAGLNYTNRRNSATTNVFGSGSGLTSRYHSVDQSDGLLQELLLIIQELDMQLETLFQL